MQKFELHKSWMFWERKKSQSNIFNESFESRKSVFMLKKSMFVSLHRRTLFCEVVCVVKKSTHNHFLRITSLCLKHRFLIIVAWWNWTHLKYPVHLVETKVDSVYHSLLRVKRYQLLWIQYNPKTPPSGQAEPMRQKSPQLLHRLSPWLSHHRYVVRCHDPF